MKVKATKTMAAFLRKSIPEYDFLLSEFYPENYALYVDHDIYRNEIDYKPSTGRFSAIKVVYPSELFAMPQYLTTIDLTRIFRRSDRTERGFVEKMREEIDV